MQPSAERPFCLEDYLPFLKLLSDSEDESVLVGGLAVSAWAELFRDELERHDFDLPIFSKDIDLRGRKMTCLALTKIMQLNGAILGGVVAATRTMGQECLMLDFRQQPSHGLAGDSLNFRSGRRRYRR